MGKPPLDDIIAEQEYMCRRPTAHYGIEIQTLAI